MGIVEVKAKLKGQECILKVESDPTFDEFLRVVRASTNPQGGHDGFIFLKELAISVVRDGVPFDRKSPTEWAMLPMSEMTAFISKVTAQIPLQSYMENFKDNPMLQSLVATMV